MLIMKPNRKKEQFLFIAGRLSGSKEKYITGSGESAAVVRRVAIYRQETGVPKEDRSYRINCSLPNKRNHSTSAAKVLATKPCTSTPRSPTKHGQKCSTMSCKEPISCSPSTSKPGQKRKYKVKDSFENGAALGETTPCRPPKKRSSSITATKKPTTATPRAVTKSAAKSLQLTVDVHAADVTESTGPICPVTPVDQPGTAFFPSEPFTPTKARRFSSENAHFMSSSTDWPQYLPLGTSKDEPPSSPCGGWVEIPVFMTQPLETGVPTRVLAGKDLDLYLTGAGLGDVLLGECFDVLFAN